MADIPGMTEVRVDAEIDRASLYQAMERDPVFRQMVARVMRQELLKMARGIKDLFGKYGGK